MRVLFMGTSGFAISSLEALLRSEHQVIGVVTQPDRPTGRGLHESISPLKLIAGKISVPIYQPERVRNEEFINQVRDLSPDVIVVAAFGQIIPKAILDIPRFGSVNVHASLLPKYRGAAPVHYAIFEGEIKTGVTTMLMDPGLDTGDMLLQCEVEIEPTDNTGTLEVKLAEVGAKLLLETLKGLERGEITPKPQDSSLATVSPSVKREECAIRWGTDAKRIVNRIRGCSPRPGAYTTWQGSPLKIWGASTAAGSSDVEPGVVIKADSEGIIVKAGDGLVMLTEVQPENKKRMSAAEFARGYRVSSGSHFSG